MVVACTHGNPLRLFWTKSKELNGSFSVGHKGRYQVDLKHLAVARNWVNGQHSIHLMWFFSGRCINNQCVCNLILFIGRKIATEVPIAFSSFWFLKEKLVTRVFHLYVVRCEGNILLTLFATKCLHMAAEKKIQSPLGACLKKLISDPELEVNTVYLFLHLYKNFTSHYSFSI